MVKVVLIDDEPLARAVVKEYLQDYTEFEIVQECSDGFEGIKAIQKYRPELIFLDIQMPKINGFEMLELVDELPSVIFTTAFDEYAIKAFETNTIDYLLKPFGKERFSKAIKKWKEQRKDKLNQNSTEILLELPTKQLEENRVVVKVGNEIRILNIADIHFIEAYDDYVKINTKDDCFLKKKTMHYFEQTLNSSDFVRVHRSFIVQIQQITKIESVEKDNFQAVLKSGMKVPLSKNGYAKLKNVLKV